MKNRNQSAFPTQPPQHNGLSGEEYGLIYGNPGLTKREYFAAMILQGLAAKYILKEPSDQVTITQMAVELSDELSKQLEA